MRVSLLTAAIVTLIGTPAISGSLAVYQCFEKESCDAEGKCKFLDTRLNFSKLAEKDGAERVFLMGPLVSSAGGGVFYETSVLYSDDVPEVGETGRSVVLFTGDGIAPEVYLNRPASEARGFRGSGWITSVYECEQELY